MRFATLEAAKAAKFPTRIDDGNLDLAQVNHLCARFEAAKEAGDGLPMQVAFDAFRGSYEAADGGWRLRTYGDEGVSAEPTQEEERQAKVRGALHEFLTGPVAMLRDKVLFRPGVHNGYKYTSADLKDMAANYEATREYLVPPVKIGHDSWQRVAALLGLDLADADGIPRLGEWTNIWYDADEDALMGTAENVPAPLAALVESGRFLKVSIEHWINYYDEQADKVRKNWLTAVSFLGIDLPGMLEQEDALQVAHSVIQDGHELRRITFSAAATATNTEDESMEMKELLAQFEVETPEALVEKFTSLTDTLTRTFAMFGEDVADFDGAQAKFSELTERITALESADADRAKADAEAADAAAEEKVEQTLKAALDEGRIDPSEVEPLRAFALKLDTAEMRTFTVGDAEVEGSARDEYLALVAARPVKREFGEKAETAKGDEPGTGTKVTLTADQKAVADQMKLTEDEYIEHMDK